MLGQFQVSQNRSPQVQAVFHGSEKCLRSGGLPHGGAPPAGPARWLRLLRFGGDPTGAAGVGGGAQHRAHGGRPDGSQKDGVLLDWLSAFALFSCWSGVGTCFNILKEFVFVFLG